jgi:hypothetical protein
MDYYGVPAKDLFGLAPQYFPAENDETYISPSGKVISPKRQKEILASAQSSYFFALVRLHAKDADHLCCIVHTL